MARSGMNPKTLQYLMGHSDISVTMNTYTHLGLFFKEKIGKERIMIAQGKVLRKSILLLCMCGLIGCNSVGTDSSPVDADVAVSEGNKEDVMEVRDADNQALVPEAEEVTEPVEAVDEADDNESASNAGVVFDDSLEYIGDLSVDECYEFTEYFQENGLYGMLLGSYDDAADMNLEEVFYGATTNPEYIMTDTELAEYEGDCYVKTIDEINEKLEKYTGLKNNEFSKPLITQKVDGKESVVQTMYDTNLRFPNCRGGYLKNSAYVLLFDNPCAAVILEKSGNDYVIKSNRFFENSKDMYNSAEKYTPDTFKYKELNKFDLQMIINEYYARRGMIFNNEMIKLYFESMPWYEGTVASDKFDEAVFNDVEKKNIDFVKAMMK